MRRIKGVFGGLFHEVSANNVTRTLRDRVDIFIFRFFSVSVSDFVIIDVIILIYIVFFLVKYFVSVVIFAFATLKKTFIYSVECQR